MTIGTAPDSGNRMTAERIERRDLVIGGGGFAGLALAIALRQGLGETFTVDGRRSGARRGHVEATRAPRRSRPRRGGCSRRSASGMRSPARRSRSSTWWSPTPSCEDAVRPTFLTFAGEVEPGEPFAHMIENRHLIDALVGEGEGGRRRAARRPRWRVSRVRRASSRCGLPTARQFPRGCWSRADGARSAIREQAGIASARLELRPVGHRHHGGA